MAVDVGTTPPSTGRLEPGGAGEDPRPSRRERRRHGTALAASAAVAIVLGTGLSAVAWSAAPRPPVVRHDVPVSAMDSVFKPANNSPSLVVDPTEPRFVLEANRRDAPYDCSLDVSGDGGRGWTTAAGVVLPQGVDSCYGPEVAFDAAGRLYFLFVGLHGAGHSPIGVFLTTSTDRARSFAPPVLVLGPERYQVRMAIDPTLGPRGRIHLAWLEAGGPPPTGGFAPVPSPIMAAHSDDGGRSWSAPVRISDANRAFVDAPALALGPHHRVHVVYYDLGRDARDYEGLEGPAWDGTWSLISTTSADGGATFAPGVVVDDGVVPPGRVILIYTMAPPSVAVDAGDDVFVSWWDNRNADWDVFLRRSLDGGRHFEAPIRLNDDLVHDGISQYLPKLSVAHNGRIDAIFYDRRGDPKNHFDDVMYTYSADRGRTWSRNAKLTTWPSDPSLGPQYLVPSAKGLIEFGSRLALVSSGSKVVAAWTDTRNEQRGNGSQDIFANEVDFPGLSPRWQLLRVGGAAAVVAGLVLLAAAAATRRQGP